MRRDNTGWPPLQDHIAGPEILGYSFNYPPQYLECIGWGDEDFDAGGDGHAMSFLTKPDIVRDLFFVRRATRKRLVPFARGDNGDWLFCFDGEGGKEIYVVNLGGTPLRAHNTGFTDFVEFLNDYRSRMGLVRWSHDLKPGSGFK